MPLPPTQNGMELRFTKKRVEREMTLMQDTTTAGLKITMMMVMKLTMTLMSLSLGDLEPVFWVDSCSPLSLVSSFLTTTNLKFVKNVKAQ